MMYDFSFDYDIDIPNTLTNNTKKPGTTTNNTTKKTEKPLTAEDIQKLLQDLYERLKKTTAWTPTIIRSILPFQARGYFKARPVGDAAAPAAVATPDAVKRALLPSEKMLGVNGRAFMDPRKRLLPQQPIQFIK